MCQHPPPNSGPPFLPSPHCRCLPYSVHIIECSGRMDAEESMGEEKEKEDPESGCGQAFLRFLGVPNPVSPGVASVSRMSQHVLERSKASSWGILQALARRVCFLYLFLS